MKGRLHDTQNAQTCVQRFLEKGSFDNFVHRKCAPVTPGPEKAHKFCVRRAGDRGERRQTARQVKRTEVCSVHTKIRALREHLSFENDMLAFTSYASSYRTTLLQLVCDTMRQTEEEAVEEAEERVGRPCRVLAGVQKSHPLLWDDRMADGASNSVVAATHVRRILPAGRGNLVVAMARLGIRSRLAGVFSCWLEPQSPGDRPT